MELKPIITLDPATHEQYAATWDALREKYGMGGKIDEDILFSDYVIEKCFTVTPIRGWYKYAGFIKDGIDLTELELSMICYGGFGHSGGTSTIRPDRSFTVEIYTD